ncbi:hypothetical protein, partial [Escherichia coli]|uniref:hypothetical protein n=1 Tax=Escherichia coli TaxID=562 RepID=UPI001E5133F8
LSGAPGCVTWELILDGYSESSYSATPRFAAARLPWFSHLRTYFQRFFWSGLHRHFSTDSAL